MQYLKALQPRKNIFTLGSSTHGIDQGLHIFQNFIGEFLTELKF